MDDFSRFYMHDKLKRHCILAIKSTRPLTKGITLCLDIFRTVLLQESNFKNFLETFITMRSIGRLVVSNFEVQSFF